MKLYGKNPVIERLKTNPQSIRKIYLQENHPDSAYIRKKASRWGLPVFIVPASRLQKMARDLNTQGIVVEVDDFAYVPYPDLLSSAVKKKETLVFLDGITDPQNLGALIRSLACLGRFGVVLPTHDSVGVTETVLRIACGGENFVRVARVSNLSQAIVSAKEAGYWIAGSVVENGEDITQTELPSPVGLVIGSEQKGIRPVVQKIVDVCVTIPMAQQRMSMNVAHAAAILCYEILRQRKRHEKKNTSHPEESE